MKRNFWGILLPLAGLLSFSQVIAQSASFNQRPVRVSDETNKQPDQASRYVWAFDNQQSEQFVSGETMHEFTSFGIGVSPSEPLHFSDIQLEYKLANGKWKEVEVDFSPEIIQRDNLYWTDLNFTNGNPCNQIEIKVKLPQGIFVDSLKLHVIDVDMQKRTDHPVLTKNTGMRSADCPVYPTVIPRSVWLDPYYTQPAYTPTVINSHHIVIHHGASPDTYTDGAAVVRSYWNYHVNSNGWSDIGYNYLTDKDGNIYKGRMNGDPENQDCRGAHAGASNNESIGINFLGNSDVTNPTVAQLNAVYQLLGWWFNKRGFDPLVSANITLQSGGTASVPRICGHRDVNIGGTTCPGDALYADLSDIRTGTQAAIDACNSLYSYGTTYGDFIDGVELIGDSGNDISNLTTGATNGPSYNDYTATHSASLITGESYTLTITNGDYGDETLAAWIDFDQDGNFEASEKIGEATAVDANASASLTINVPESALLGTTEMRVRAVWSNTSIDAYSEYSFGEAEDYSIEIISPCTTPGIPVSLYSDNVSDDAADLHWSSGTPLGSPLVVYYWAVGYSGSNPTYQSNFVDRGFTTNTFVSTAVSLDANTDYDWSVKAFTNCDNTTTAYASYESFTTGCETPDVPVSLSVSDVSNTNASLSWLAGTNAGSPTVTYYWAVNTSSTVDYESNYVKRGTTTDLSVIVYGLNPGISYYFTVKAETSCGVGSESSYASNVNFSTTAISTNLTWTGALSNEWNESANWSPNQIPTVLDDVYIPDVSSASNRYPVTQYNLGVNNDTPSRKCKSLNIASGASVTLAGGSSELIVEGVLDLYGTLNHECGPNSNLFKINAGGQLTVYENAVLNVGSSSFSTVPAGTIDQYNDVYVNGGVLKLEPDSKTFIMDNLVVLNSGSFIMEGGELWIKYYGDGSANSLGFDVYAAATINIAGGDIFLCGQDNGASAQMLDWNASATIDVTGGNITALDEQSSGSLNYDAILDFGGHPINNLIIERPSAETSLLSNLRINGALVLNSGVFDPMHYDLSLYGDLLNHGGEFNPREFSILYFYGTDNVIGGNTSTQMDLCMVQFETGASYLFNPVNVTNFNFMGSFHMSGNSSLEIAAGKYLDIYASDSEGESVYFYGELISSSNYDNQREVDFNNACNFGGTNIAADIRIYDDLITITNDMVIYGDFEIYDGGTTSSQGSLAFNSDDELTIYGDFINNYALTAGASCISMAGTGRSITGDSEDDFNDLKILSGASISFNPLAASNDFDVYGDFITEAGSSLTIESGKFIDLYSSTAEAESVVLNGDIQAVDVFNSIPDIELNENVQLSGNGSINADVRVFNNTTTLVSDFIVDGDFATYDDGVTYHGSFEMQNHTLTVNGDFNNDYRFIRGTGTVKFAGTTNQLIETGCSNSDCDADAEDVNFHRFYHVLVANDPSAEVRMSDHLRAEGDFILQAGRFSTGDATYGKKINIYGTTNIEDGGIFNVGNSVYNSGDVADFHDNLIVRGQIVTDRDIKDGYAEVRSYASRLYAEGDVDEINADMQVYLPEATEQFSDIYISGDLIVQSLNEFQCNDPNLSLTIGGDLFIYHNFSHCGTVNLYGDFRENTPVGEEAEVCNIASSTFNMYGNHKINFNPSSGFGNLNIISGTRSVNEIGGQSPYSELDIKGNLTIEDGAAIDFGTAGKDINIEGNWIVEGTGDFVTATQKVSFTGSSSDQYIYIDPSSPSSFYQLDLNKTAGNLILQSDCEVERQIDMYLSGLSLEGNTLYLSGAVNSINSFMDGGAYAGYIISESEDNSSIFKRNFGTSALKYYPFATASGESLAMIITNNNSGVDNLGDVSVATYPTGSGNTPLPTNPDPVTYLNEPGLTSDVHSQLVDRFWQLDASGTVNDVNVSFTYVDNAWDAFTLTAQRWNGSSWDNAPANSSHNTSNNTVTVSNVSEFSPWVLVKEDWELPVEMLSFDAKANQGNVDLSWVTANEFNNDYFVVERSADLEAISDIAVVQGAGFSNHDINYYVMDEHPLSGVSYYRLRQVDFDGKTSYTDWKAISIDQNEIFGGDIDSEGPALNVLSVYPNPSNGPLNVIYNLNQPSVVNYQIIGHTGKVSLNGEIYGRKGLNDFIINGKDLANGVYVLVLQAGNKRSTYKLVILH